MAGTALKSLALNSLVLTSADYTTLTGLIDNKADKTALEALEGKIASDVSATNQAQGKTYIDNAVKAVDDKLGACTAADPAAAKSYVDQECAKIPKFAIEVVTELPTSDISETTVYLKTSGTEEGNLYDEFIYVNKAWEKLGSQKMDLSGYYTKTEVDSKLAEKQDKLTDAQVAAVDSGITAAKVEAYDAYETEKADVLGTVAETITVAELITKLGGTIA